MPATPLPQPHDPGAAALSDAMRVSFRVLRFVMILLLAAYLLSGLFIVGQQEKAFVLLFGRVSGTGDDRVKGPGIHWTLPKPFAEIVRVPTERVQAVESVSFWHNQDGPLPGKFGYALTGDTNLLHSKWAVRYTIADPAAVTFGFAAITTVLADELDHAVVRTLARFTVDQALRTDIEAVRGAVTSELKRRLDALGAGVKIEGVDLLSLSPPRQVIESFNAVVAAENERSEKINAARGYAARTANETLGRAAKLTAEGQAYAQRIVSTTGADADYFLKVNEQYRQNPDLIAQTLLQDTLRRTLAGVEKNLVAPGRDGHYEIRLQLSPEQKPLVPAAK